MTHHFTLGRILLCLMLLATATAFTSCGDDEPSGTSIDYYLEVEEEFLVDGATDHTDRYHSPITLMKEVIRNAYPKASATGDDDAVIRACDELQLRYIGMYEGKTEEHLTCLMHLVRATKSGDIVKQSERLKSYNFDINPPEEEVNQ